MLKTALSIEQISKEVVNFLSQYIKVDKIILFGSYAYGRPRKDSDFDIAVISEDIEKIGILEKIDLFSKVAVAVDYRIELKGFGSDEFLNPERGSLLEVVKKQGRIIYDNRME